MSQKVSDLLYGYYSNFSQITMADLILGSWCLWWDLLSIPHNTKTMDAGLVKFLVRTTGMSIPKSDMTDCLMGQWSLQAQIDREKQLRPIREGWKTGRWSSNYRGYFRRRCKGTKEKDTIIISSSSICAWKKKDWGVRDSSLRMLMQRKADAGGTWLWPFHLMINMS